MAPLWLRAVAVALALLTLHLGSAGFTRTPDAATDGPTPELSGTACGVYSAHMALRAVGLPSEFVRLLDRRYIGSASGSSAAELCRAVADAGGRATAFDDLTVATLRSTPDPIILHVRQPGQGAKFDHWVLFLGCDGHSARVIDPPGPPREVPLAELLALWDGGGVVVHGSGVRGPVGASSWLDGATALGLVAAVLGLFGRPSGRVGRDAARLLLAAGAAAAVWHTIRPEGYLWNRGTAGLAVGRHQLPAVPELTLEEYAALAARDPVVVDARLTRDYQAGHIPGAVSLPITLGWLERARAADALPPGRPVVVYCQSEGCRWSDEVAAALMARGRPEVSVLRAGYAGWGRYRDRHTPEPR